MARLKGDPIPDGFIACGRSGRAVNVGVSVDREYRAEAARQRRVWNHFLAIQIDTYAVLGEFVFYHESVHDRDRAAGRWLDRRGNEIRNSALAEVGRQSPEPVPSAPKRGSAKVGKDRASARSGRPGPPANVPPPVREARVSTG